MYINKWHITFFETKTEGVSSCDIHITPPPPPTIRSTGVRLREKVASALDKTGGLGLQPWLLGQYGRPRGSGSPGVPDHSAECRAWAEVGHTWQGARQCQVQLLPVRAGQLNLGGLPQPQTREPHPPASPRRPRLLCRKRSRTPHGRRWSETVSILPFFSLVSKHSYDAEKYFLAHYPLSRDEGARGQVGDRDWWKCGKTARMSYGAAAASRPGGNQRGQMWSRGGKALYTVDSRPGKQRRGRG